MHDYQKLEPVFIGGCPRSGTTMLGVQIADHPLCFTTPESHFIYQLNQLLMKQGSIIWGEFVAIVERHTFYATWEIEPDWASYAAAGQSIDLADAIRWLVWQYRLRHCADDVTPIAWIDHTPENVLHSHSLLKLFPQARFVHLKRDGRACFASVKDLNWGPNSPTMAANWWLKYVGMGDATLSAFPDRTTEIYFEEFVRGYPASLSSLLEWLRLPVKDLDSPEAATLLPADLLQYQHRLVSQKPDASRIDSWRETLKPMEIVRFDATASNLLKLNGYQPLAPYEPELPLASIGCYLWEFFVLPFRLMSFGFVWRKYIVRTYFRWFRRGALAARAAQKK